ncbi:MAG TPA: 30S ribosomal protein S6 [Thermoanaerobaculia bacterium]|nr:30S ribosomal protein S6 [Thermoanaerobaculia bacterium]
MRTYEVLFILSPKTTEEEQTKLVSDFKAIGEGTGAKLVNEEPWGRRRLAYPIHKFSEGVYHLFVFESEDSLAELDRRMKNSDLVLRHLIVRTDLETRRAIKLAKKNPKKERVRPSPAGDAAATPAPSPAPAVAPPPPVAEPAPVETAASEAAAE